MRGEETLAQLAAGAENEIGGCRRGGAARGLRRQPGEEIGAHPPKARERVAVGVVVAADARRGVQPGTRIVGTEARAREKVGGVGHRRPAHSAFFAASCT